MPASTEYTQHCIFQHIAVGHSHLHVILAYSYRNTKLILALAARILASKVSVEQSNVVINLVCPGFCSTDLNKNAPAAIRERSAKNKEAYGRSPDHGSRTLLFGAVAGPESHGKLTASCEIAEYVANRRSRIVVLTFVNY